MVTHALFEAPLMWNVLSVHLKNDQHTISSYSIGALLSGQVTRIKNDQLGLYYQILWPETKRAAICNVSIFSHLILKARLACHRQSRRLPSFLWKWCKTVLMALCWIFWYSGAKYKIPITLLQLIVRGHLDYLNSLHFRKCRLWNKTTFVFQQNLARNVIYSRPQDLTGLSLLLVVNYRSQRHYCCVYQLSASLIKLNLFWTSKNPIYVMANYTKT